MSPETVAPQEVVSEREARFLQSLSRKYARSDEAGRVRSYLIAASVLLLLFALARWIPWWGLALAIVEGLGLFLFHQYKRFGRFKTRLLIKLWSLVSDRETPP